MTVPSKKNKHNNLKVLKVTDEKEQDPDPLVKGADSRIRIRTRMSRIRNTAHNPCGSGLETLVAVPYGIKARSRAFVMIINRVPYLFSTSWKSIQIRSMLSLMVFKIFSRLLAEKFEYEVSAFFYKNTHKF
jgi:hypothetical protein